MRRAGADLREHMSGVHKTVVDPLITGTGA